MLDRAEVRTIRTRLQDRLDAFDDNYKVHIGNATFSENNVTFKVTVSVVGEDGKAITKEAEDFQHYAFRYGLKAEDLGRKFKRWGGDTYEIIGAKPRSRKYPILARQVATGKVYKFTAQEIKLLLDQAQTKS